ncbi:MAG TPA: class II aldolase/adducin family protein [Caulobacteraceae bacterium]|jgi:HCOMODA/2-hydroxy-3-carboxy-muconic semialdehyde decarboxylase|nr:class II aldolase/adducin family protein [Caulobacteraceae bacterium]
MKRTGAGAVGAAALLLLLAPIASAQAPAAADSDDQRIAELVVANHILADQGVLDGFGHVSVRSLKNPRHFFMARSVAPALVTRDDILEFDENSQPVDQRGRELYSERFIHGEILRVRPDVQSVVHSHSAAVLPFSVTKTPLKALIHVAYFLGTEPAPVFDIRDAEGQDNRMLVQSAKTGAALARTLGPRAVALMRGHGMAVAGGSVREAVFEAIYTQVNARIETEALKLGPPVFMNRFEVMRTERIARQWDLWASAVAPSR